MPWCPNCKNEYKEGFTVCADCGAALVASLEEVSEVNRIKFTFGNQETMEKLSDFLKFGGLSLADVLCNEELPDEEKYYIEIDCSEEALARKLTGVFYKDIQSKEQAMAENEVNEDVDAPFYDFQDKNDENRDDTVIGSGGVYVKASDRAENYKSSASALLTCGIIGALFLILVNMEVLPIQLGESVKTMATIVLGLMFVIFIIMGVKALKDSKKYAEMSDEEEQTTEEIQSWFERNYTADGIDEAIGMLNDDMEEEMKYFSRCEYMRKEICNKFGPIDMAYLDKNIEDMYPKIFEN